MANVNVGPEYYHPPQNTYQYEPGNTYTFPVEIRITQKITYCIVACVRELHKKRLEAHPLVDGYQVDRGASRSAHQQQRADVVHVVLKEQSSAKLQRKNKQKKIRTCT